MNHKSDKNLFLDYSKSFFNILIVNILVFITIILSLELLYRTLSFTKSCLRNCDKKLLLNFYIKPDANLGIFNISKYDPNLGFIPKSNLNLLLNNSDWNNKSLITLKDGIRKTIPKNNSQPKVLTVGDSFAFGDQVSNNETWQSCLNKRIKKFDFVNAGVFAYGTGQAVMRAKILSNKDKYDYLIVQTLVGFDLVRDQQMIRQGHLKPFFTKVDNSLIINRPLPKNTENTKWGQVVIKPHDYLFANLRILDKTKAKGLRQKSINVFNRLKTQYPENPAPVKMILEWAVDQSKEINKNVFWVLQYRKENLLRVQMERQLIRKILNQKGIPFVDTYDVLLGKNRIYSSDQLWNGHHTPKGNLVVCNEIKDFLSE